jgi:hypothetical protein
VELRQEIIETQKARMDLHKWKIIYAKPSQRLEGWSSMSSTLSPKRGSLRQRKVA